MRGFAVSLTLFMCASWVQASTNTYFPLADISDDASGLWASASALVTSGPGYVEVLVQNSSPRQDDFQGSGGSANPFITELEINLGGYEAIAATSYVASSAATLYGQGAGNPAITMGPDDLYYKLVSGDYPGMDVCLMFGEADNLRNDNAIGSLDALDASDIPQEDFATGFLNPLPHADSGAVFDIAIFHFTLNTTETPDTSYWATDNLVVKYQGGGDYSKHVANPEPGTFAVFTVAALMLLRRRRG